MIDFKENFRLKSYNTFGIDAKAKYFVEISDKIQMNELIQTEIYRNNKRLILGGGSNVLFTNDFDGLIIHPVLNRIDIIDENKSDVLLDAGCGVVWDDLVQFCVDNGWGGLENLSDIPGNVGACPIQNIGAYGVEVESAIAKVFAFDFTTGKKIEFDRMHCQFGYRDSIFKRIYRDSLLITNVIFKLHKPPHRLVTSYTALAKELDHYKEKNIAGVREIIKKIRRSKLPAVDQLGSAGSFFKNPMVEGSIALSIASKYPDMPNFPTEEGKVKLSAAWLIDKSGCKGLQFGDASTYLLQPLVIVNHGKASGQQVVQLSKMVQEKVYNNFKVMLEPEVNFI